MKYIIKLIIKLTLLAVLKDVQIRRGGVLSVAHRYERGSIDAHRCHAEAIAYRECERIIKTHIHEIEKAGEPDAKI